jgi:hypothetical protein
MTIEGIIRMAKQAGFADEEIDTCQQIFIHFAKLVAEHERKECEKVCDEFLPLGNKCAYTIRARGQA